MKYQQAISGIYYSGGAPSPVQLVRDKDKTWQGDTMRYAFAQAIHLQNLPIPKSWAGNF
jgi:hypothetical protein